MVPCFSQLCVLSSTQVPAAKSAATVTRDPSDILAKPKRTYSQLISEALLNAQNK